MALLEIEGLGVEIGTPLGPVEILREVGLTLERGESLGLVGESGCGKSMTALAILGLLPDAARARGRIVQEGRNRLELGEAELCRLRGRRIAMVFQEPMTALNPVRSIGDQVAEGLRLHLGLDGRKALDRAAALLERVGLPQADFPLGLHPHQLSGGQRQRVVVAMALACGPDILIADEPTTALDVTIQAQILDLMRELRDKLGTAMLLITHDMGVIAEHAERVVVAMALACGPDILIADEPTTALVVTIQAQILDLSAELAEEEGMALILISHDLGVIAEMTDRMAVMYAGAIVESGPTAEVFRRRAHPYTEGLFAALPSLHAVAGDRLASIPGQVPDPLRRPPGCAFAPRCPRASGACDSAPRRSALGAGHEVCCFHPLREARP